MKNLKIRLLAAVIVVAGLIQVVLINSFAPSGGKLAKLERERRQLSADISGLNNKISEKTSLTSINTKALEIGLINPTNSFDFVTPSLVAVITNVTP